MRHDRILKPGERAPMSWEWELLSAALLWQYGVDRAVAIFSGQDPATQADLAKWRSLGR